MRPNPALLKRAPTTDSVQITCVTKRNGPNPHERIGHIGGITADHNRWKLDEDAAIAGIRSGKWKFYVNVAGEGVWVVIATHLGHEYLKTVADDIEPTNLLCLPECP